MAYEELSRRELEEVVAALEDELERMEQTAQQVKADFENYKKRENNRKHEWQKAAQQDLAEDLITVMDNLERAMIAADENSNVLKGVEMVANELYNILSERGLKRIDTDETDEFDPQIHNAVDTKPHHENNVILETRRPGYMYHDTVLREAEVVVGKREADDTNTKNNNTTTTDGSDTDNANTDTDTDTGQRRTVQGDAS